MADFCQLVENLLHIPVVMTSLLPARTKQAFLAAHVFLSTNLLRACREHLNYKEKQKMELAFSL